MQQFYQVTLVIKVDQNIKGIYLPQQFTETWGNRLAVISQSRVVLFKNRLMFNISTGTSQTPVDIWGSLVHKVLRPPRNTYSVEELGGTVVTINGTQYTHQEVLVPFSTSFIQLSLFSPAAYKTQMIVLYLHGNSSCRLEMESLYDVLPANYSIAGFDFLACGNSEDPNYPFVSYGVSESLQAAAVTQYLQSLGYYVVLWGRSMGAISALKFGGPQVIVADSACASLKRIAREQVKRMKPEIVPGCMLGCLFPLIYAKLRCDVKTIAGFDIQELNLKRIVAAMPTDKIMVFISGDDDNVIDSNNSETLYNSYRGYDKQIIIFKGNHNTSRPKNVLSYVFNYIDTVLANRQRHLLHSTQAMLSSQSFYGSSAYF